MKATGIVRRIDDLGRVVIPKEIRRTMRIREGDPLEIFTDREGEVIFKKYSPISELADVAVQYAEALHKTSGLSVVITDRDTVIACSGVPRREFADKALSQGMEKIIGARSLYVRKEGDERVPLANDGDAQARFVGCAMPILCEGDIIGCAVSMHVPGEEHKNDVCSDTEIKLIQTAAGFLGRQMEA